MKKHTRYFLVAAVLLAAFAAWTVLISCVDVQPIGPQGSRVGLAALNRFVHGLTGVHLPLYVVTDWLGLVPIAVAFGFGVLGLCQWIARKDIRRVDRSLLLLGGFYVAVMAFYALFEYLVINDRPVLIEGRLEASYPSSTTMLVLCVMPTAWLQLQGRVRGRMLSRLLGGVIALFCAFMLFGRLLSGVHWVTDIIGGGLLSAGLVFGYAAALCAFGGQGSDIK